MQIVRLMVLIPLFVSCTTVTPEQQNARADLSAKGYRYDRPQTLTQALRSGDSRTVALVFQANDGWPTGNDYRDSMLDLALKKKNFDALRTMLSYDFSPDQLGAFLDKKVAIRGEIRLKTAPPTRRFTCPPSELVRVVIEKGAEVPVSALRAIAVRLCPEALQIILTKWPNASTVALGELLGGMGRAGESSPTSGEYWATPEGRSRWMTTAAVTLPGVARKCVEKGDSASCAAQGEFKQRAAKIEAEQLATEESERARIAAMRSPVTALQDACAADGAVRVNENIIKEQKVAAAASGVADIKELYDAGKSLAFYSEILAAAKQRYHALAGHDLNLAECGAD